jgi:hypothetical protein
MPSILVGPADLAPRHIPATRDSPMTKQPQIIQFFVGAVLAILSGPAVRLHGQTSEDLPSASDRVYHEEIRPILVQHCLACHDAKESSAGVILERYAMLLVAGPKGRLVQPGDPDGSRLIQAIRGENGLEKMPPEDQPPMVQEQIDRIVQWVRDGAPGSDIDLPLAKRLSLKAPAAQHGRTAAITSLVFGDRTTTPWAGRTGAIGRWDAKEGRLVQSQPWVGKINQMRRSADGTRIAIASGLAGVGGQASVLDAKTGELICQVEHPKEMISTAVISPDGKWLASGSYDARIDLWEIPSGNHVRSFAGHHGPIGDLDFDPSSTLLASASRDETIKLWLVDSAERLDTLGQAEDAQRSVRFDPSGNFILGASDDRRIRIWKLESRERPAINPWLKTVFAHEAAVHQLWIDPAGRLLVSLGEDCKIRGWKLPQLEALGEPLELADLPMAIDWSDTDQQWIVPLIDGTVAEVPMPQDWRERLEQADASTTVSQALVQADEPMAVIAGDLVQREEQEPNGDLASAMPIEGLALVRGSIDSNGKEGKPDEDWFRIEAKKGQRWVIEVDAARSGSPLDSRIEIRSADGCPLLRQRLQAVRESYFTFRGKSSEVSDDFRLHQWQEMELNEYLYAGGEVVKLWLYPRGPDSGFKVYPGYGKRRAFFDTTPVAHALGEPAWIVRPLSAGEQPQDNGLPVFSIYYENDDASNQRLGKDSKLTWNVPEDGSYLIRLRDARGTIDQPAPYQLKIRPPEPSFQLLGSGMELTINQGTGREFEVAIQREDDFEQEVELVLEGLPEALQSTQPATIQEGQDKAILNIALPREPVDGLPESGECQLVARAKVGGQMVERRWGQPIQWKRIDAPKVRLEVVRRVVSQDKIEPWPTTPEGIPIIEILPGQTVSGTILAQRGAHAGDIAFGNEDSGRNLPHGVIVDNIGLNGLMIPAGRDSQEFFLTAAPWLKPQERLFHFRATTQDQPTTLPILLRVVTPQQVAQQELPLPGDRP